MRAGSPDIRYNAMNETSSISPYGLQNPIPYCLGEKIAPQDLCERGCTITSGQTPGSQGLLSRWVLYRDWNRHRSCSSANDHSSEVQCEFCSGSDEEEYESSVAGEVCLFGEGVLIAVESGQRGFSFQQLESTKR